MITLKWQNHVNKVIQFLLNSYIFNDVCKGCVFYFQKNTNIYRFWIDYLVLIEVYAITLHLTRFLISQLGLTMGFSKPLFNGQIQVQDFRKKRVCLEFSKKWQNCKIIWKIFKVLLAKGPHMQLLSGYNWHIMINTISFLSVNVIILNFLGDKNVWKGK